MSLWSKVPLGPPDKIFGLVEAFKQDEDPRKQSLVVGAYRTEEGNPWVLPSIRAAEEKVMAAHMNKEYTTIGGVPEYVELSRKFAFGKDSPALAEGRVASVQALSGTGSLRLIGEYYAKFLGQGSPIYLPNPTWGNHANIFRSCGLDVREYRYWDPKTLGLDLEGMLADLKAAPAGSAVLLHAVAHNPTGVDPTKEQWARICAELKARSSELALLFDCAYQGFASGDAEDDAFSLRHFVNEGVPFALAQSFAKNFGLYGERAGCVSFSCADADEAARVASQLKIIIRPMYSNPPVHGARIVAAVLSDPEVAAAPARHARPPRPPAMPAPLHSSARAPRARLPDAPRIAPVPAARGAVALRVQDDGRAHHRDALRPVRRDGGDGVGAHVEPHHRPDRHVLLHRDVGRAGREASLRVPHLPDE